MLESWGVSSIEYPADRRGQRATACVAVTLAGMCLKPMIIVKRQTIDTRLYAEGSGDKAHYIRTESSYINSEAYEQWILQVILPYVMTAQDMTREWYQGPTYVLQDGCRAHKLTPQLISRCCNRIEFIKLPPHSSHLVQPLDLSLFSAQKRYKSRIRLPQRFGDLDEQSRNAILIVDSLRMATTPRNVVASFSDAGITVTFDIVGDTCRLLANVDVSRTSKVQAFLRDHQQGSLAAGPILVAAAAAGGDGVGSSRGGGDTLDDVLNHEEEEEEEPPAGRRQRTANGHPLFQQDDGQGIVPEGVLGPDNAGRRGGRRPRRLLRIHQCLGQGRRRQDLPLKP